MTPDTPTTPSASVSALAADIKRLHRDAMHLAVHDASSAGVLRADRSWNVIQATKAVDDAVDRLAAITGTDSGAGT